MPNANDVTHRTMLWFDNDHGLYEICKEEAERLCDHYYPAQQQCLVYMTTYIANMLEEMREEAYNAIKNPIMREILDVSVAHIDCRYLATGYIDAAWALKEDEG